MESSGRAEIGTAYALNGYKFAVEEFFPEELKDEVTEVRVEAPDLVEAEMERRTLREALTVDGKLVILAADHPGRMVTKSGDDPIAMGDRLEYLGRVLRVVACSEVDGVMATPDIIDDLVIVNYLVRERTGADFLANRVLIGSMNRGGLSGAAFEMDDTMTSYTVEGIVDRRLDAAKLMVRLDVSSYDSAQTLMYTAEAVRECHEYGVPIFVESLPGTFESNKWTAAKEADALIKIVGVASALGDSTVLTWLKLPYCEGYERVARSTTCPILMLGGESRGDPTFTMEDFEKGMGAGGNVRGALVGRNVLFPGNDDPAAVAQAIVAIVHDNATTLEAVRLLSSLRGQDTDALTKRRRGRRGRSR